SKTSTCSTFLTSSSSGAETAGNPFSPGASSSFGRFSSAYSLNHFHSPPIWPARYDGTAGLMTRRWALGRVILVSPSAAERQELSGPRAAALRVDPLVMRGSAPAPDCVTTRRYVVRQARQMPCCPFQLARA